MNRILYANFIYEYKSEGISTPASPVKRLSTSVTVSYNQMVALRPTARHFHA